MGGFMLQLEAGKFAEACDCIGFQGLSSVFVVQGESRNRTNEICANWMYDVFNRPLVAALRMGPMSKEDVGKQVERISTLTKLFADNEKASELCTKFIVDSMNASLVILRSLSEKPPAPTEIRVALSYMQSRPNKDALNLAFKHGALGQAAMTKSMKSVEGSEKDEISSRHLARVTGLFNKFVLTMPAEQTYENFKATAKHLEQVQMCLQMWTASGFEACFTDLSHL